jgi:hypothetical protein
LASRYWTGGANNGTWNDVNNWSATEGGASGASVPTTGDDVFVQATSQTIAGYTTAADYLSFTVNFAGNIGTAGSPLVFGTSGTMTVRTLSGTHYLSVTSGDTIGVLHVERTGTGKVYVAGPGAATTVRLGSNVACDIAADCAVTTLEEVGAVADVAYNATAITTLKSVGGRITSNRSITTQYLGTNSSVVTKGVAAVTTSEVLGGKHTHWSSGTVTSSNVYAGEATAKGSPYNFTVTNRKTGEGAKNFTDSSNATFTNTATPIGGAV